MSKEIDTALKSLVNRFHALCQRDSKGQYNFYIDHFMRDGKAIDNAIDDLTQDYTGFFRDFIWQELSEEVEDLIRAILAAEVYVTYQAYYDPSKVFKTREEYIEHARQRAIEARDKMNEHYRKLATYYNDKAKFFNSEESKIPTVWY